VPYYFYEPTSGLINLVYPVALINNNVILVMHKTLADVLSGFAYVESGVQYYGNTIPNDFVAVQIPTSYDQKFRLDQMYPNNANYNATTPNGSTYNSFLITQEYNTGYKFYDIRRVVLLTSMPVRQEYQPDTQTSEVNGRIILTDYVVPLSTWGHLDQTLFYLPSSFDRGMDIMTNIDIYNISFDFKYEDIGSRLNGIF
jgi:hypothetical protein